MSQDSLFDPGGPPIRIYSENRRPRDPIENRARARKWRQENPERARQNDRSEKKRTRTLEWHAANPEKKWDYRLRAVYGITVADYKALLTEQGGVCAICGRPPEGRKRLAVDHDHESGAVRGLLHSACNTGLGHLGDDPVRLRAAADYVERFADGANA